MNSFGRVFRVSIFGESHGPVAGVVVDGCPAGLPVNRDLLRRDLVRRQSGQPGTTPRRESDEPEILSGVFGGRATGAPILILFRNQDTRSKDYDRLRKTPRPGHADFTALIKYGGYHDHRGSGHFSGRITLGLVAAGAIARQAIAPAEVEATLLQAGGRADIETAVQEAMAEQDSVGGLIECTARGVAAGLGEPFFDPAESLLAHLLFAIPAVRGVEFGAGFAAAAMRGSRHNDPIVDRSGTTATNHAGGINGGITNGNELVVRVAVKPASSIARPQQTVDLDTGEMAILEIEGRHDACIALRMPVIVESAVALVLADLLLINRAIHP